jgi:hypothetical protein
MDVFLWSGAGEPKSRLRRGDWDIEKLVKDGVQARGSTGGLQEARF